MILFNISSKKVLAVLGCVFLTLASSAQVTGSKVESQLLLCAARVTDSARLACYDGLVESLRPAGVRSRAETQLDEDIAPVAGKPIQVDRARPVVDSTTGVPVSETADNKAVAKPAVESFDTGADQKQSIRVMIEKTKRNARSDWYFYFDNGEVWKQIDSRRRRIPPLPVAATISRGIFSSHKLHIDGERWAMKIRRVK